MSKTLTVMLNPARQRDGKPITVIDPRAGKTNGKPFPNGPIELSEDDLRNPRVLHLLPRAGREGGVVGGKYGDLGVEDGLNVSVRNGDAIVVPLGPDPFCIP